MKIKSIILNVLLIIILICLIYFFIYLNNSNFENFTEGILNPELSINNNKPVSTTSIESQYGIVATTTELVEEIKVNNGLYYDRPLKNANFGYILEAVANDNDFKPHYIDGYYWINIQNVGTKYIYCIMDKKYFGGGWMLAMRSVFGSKNFSYDSPHFTSSTTLNDDPKYIYDNIIKNLTNQDFEISSIGNKIYDKTNIDPNIYDAKFDTFNYTNASEWMAIFYVKDNNQNIIRGGDYKDNKRGWVWYEKNVKIESIDNLYNKNMKLVPVIDLFKYLNNNGERKISEKYAQNMGGKFTNAKNRLQPLTNILFSSQPISEKNTSFYGLNYNSGRNISKMRWGFNFNDSNDKSNNAFGGIGTSYVDSSIIKDNGFSAGNFEINDNNAEFLDRPVPELRNISYAVEWYVRETPTYY